MLWSDFQDTADRLARGAVEGDWRSAISRTYYAVFHYFREYFLSHGFDVGRGGQSHFNLYSGLSNCGLTPVAVLGRRVDQLRTDRTKADYNLGTRIDQAYALDAVRRPRCRRRLPGASQLRASFANRRGRPSPFKVHRPHPLTTESSSWPNPSSSRPV